MVINLSSRPSFPDMLTREGMKPKFHSVLPCSSSTMNERNNKKKKMMMMKKKPRSQFHTTLTPPLKRRAQEQLKTTMRLRGRRQSETSKTRGFDDDVIKQNTFEKENPTLITLYPLYSSALILL